MVHKFANGAQDLQFYDLPVSQTSVICQCKAQIQMRVLPEKKRKEKSRKECGSCQPTFADQGSKSQSLSKTPVHALTTLYSLAAAVKDPLDTLVGVEPLWQAADGHANL